MAIFMFHNYVSLKYTWWFPMILCKNREFVTVFKIVFDLYCNNNTNIDLFPTSHYSYRSVYNGTRPRSNLILCYKIYNIRRGFFFMYNSMPNTRQSYWSYKSRKTRVQDILAFIWKQFFFFFSQTIHPVPLM